MRIWAARWGAARACSHFRHTPAQQTHAPRTTDPPRTQQTRTSHTATCTPHTTSPHLAHSNLHPAHTTNSRPAHNRPAPRAKQARRTRAKLDPSYPRSPRVSRRAERQAPSPPHTLARRPRTSGIRAPPSIWPLFTLPSPVIPAQAGTHAPGAAQLGGGRAVGMLIRVQALEIAQVPACAGMTKKWEHAPGVCSQQRAGSLRRGRRDTRGKRGYDGSLLISFAAMRLKRREPACWPARVGCVVAGVGFEPTTFGL